MIVTRSEGGRKFLCSFLKEINLDSFKALFTFIILRLSWCYVNKSEMLVLILGIFHGEAHA